MRILVALILLAVSVVAGLQMLPVAVALGNYTTVIALTVVPIVVLYVLWRLADRIIKPHSDAFQTDRRLSRIYGSPWKRVEL
jgi:archaellum biogenesis protein FlaJ (TadC family)